MSYTERQKEYTIKYLEEKLDMIRFRVPRGGKDALIEEATRQGYSAYSRYIIDAVNEKAGREVWPMPRERAKKVDTSKEPPDAPEGA